MKKLIIFFTILILTQNSSKAVNNNHTIYAYVNGLVCDFCARSLEKTIGKKDSVKSINVDLKDKLITINFNENKKLDNDEITQLIIDAGYTVREITDEKNDSSIWIQTIFPSLSLFTSLGTLICCALPALMVTLGMGATLAGIITTIPSITLISNYKEYVFIVSGILIFFWFFYSITNK